MIKTGLETILVLLILENYIFHIMYQLKVLSLLLWKVQTPFLNSWSRDNTPTVPFIDLATMPTYHISSDKSCKLILKFLYNFPDIWMLSWLDSGWMWEYIFKFISFKYLNTVLTFLVFIKKFKTLKIFNLVLAD